MPNNNHQDSTLNADQFGRVVVLYGGWSGEREVSLAGGAAVLKGLQEAGVDAVGLDATGLDVTGLDVTEMEDRHDWMAQLRRLKPAHVFIMIHGSGGEDGLVQGALESMGLAYTGSGVLASALAMDKMRCKQFWAGIGLATAPFAVLSDHSDWAQVLDSLGGSAMVKPASEGSSLGMTRVESARELEAAWALAREYDSCVLAEQWLGGAEYTVAILNGRALPTIKLETERAFYDYEAKYIADDTRYVCPCGLSEKDEATIQALAIRAYQSLDCRGWGRVDVMVGADGKFYVLEVNTVPGMTDHSLVPMAAAADGLSFSQLVVKILRGAELRATPLALEPTQ